MNTNPSSYSERRVPIREFMSQAERDRERRRQAALSELNHDWLYQMASPEAKARLISERVNAY